MSATSRWRDNGSGACARNRRGKKEEGRAAWLFSFFLFAAFVAIWFLLIEMRESGAAAAFGRNFRIRVPSSGASRHLPPKEGLAGGAFGAFYKNRREATPLKSDV